MDYSTIILIAVGLSMDSFAVSISNGITINNLNIKKSILIGVIFATTQAMFPLLGWLFGVGIKNYIVAIDHWIAFLLLTFLGIKMFYDAFFISDDSQAFDFKIRTTLTQAVATSIDAFVVGISFAVLKNGIVTPIIVIFASTFIFVLIGMILGKYIGERFEKGAMLFGGIILIFIGSKILVEHTLH